MVAGTAAYSICVVVVLYEWYDATPCTPATTTFAEQTLVQEGVQLRLEIETR